MNGVTGRMGTNQHLIRSVAAIRADGGVRSVETSSVVVPNAPESARASSG